MVSDSVSYLKILLPLLVLAGGVSSATEYSSSARKYIEKQLQKEKPEQRKLRQELSLLKWPIVFNSNAAGASNIYRMNSDGSEMVRLTDEKLSRWDTGGRGAQVSPDGKHLLWMSTSREVARLDRSQVTFDQRVPLKRRSHTNASIWKLDVDGKNWKFVTLGCDPAWAPDGKRIAYSLNTGDSARRAVAVFDLKRRQEFIVTPRNWYNYQSGGMPRYTPDGKWILSGGGGRFIGLPLDAHGTQLVEDAKPMLLVRGKGDRGCNQESTPSGKHMIWVVDTHDDYGSWLGYAPLKFGRPQHPKAMKLGWSTRSVNYDPCLSPDGKYLVYMHGRMNNETKSYNSKRSELYVSRFPPAGVHVRLTFLGASTRHPHWVKKLDVGTVEPSK